MAEAGELRCLKCGSTKVTVGVSVYIQIPSKLAHKLTKRAFATKAVQLWGASWDTASVVCGDCGHTSRGV